MEYIGETCRQLKIRMKEHETDSKVDFRKKSCKKKKDILNKKNECPTISNIWKPVFIILWKFLTQGKEVS